jgi:predicted ATPase/DNA-binding SARP family transcriptional activator/tetratricopeptide (TPR) repeat protein
MQVRLLGPIEPRSSSGAPVELAGAKLRGIVAVLALEAGIVVAPSRLADVLWGEAAGRSTNALQVAISKLRRALADAGEPDRIVTHPAGYQLDVAPEHVDALQFERLLRDASVPGIAPAVAGELLRRALDLWHGPALADAPHTDGVRALRVRLDELRRGAEEDFVDADLAQGGHGRLVPHIEALVAAEPLRERRWAQLMRALYASGQQVEALRAFTRARDVLVEEIGVEPGAELRRLEAAVLAQDDVAVLGAPVATTVPIGAGFRRRGNIRHPVGPLLGREHEVERVSRSLRSHRLVTLTGPGGAGKTRLALEVADRLERETPEGVWLAELAAARDERDVVTVVHHALGLDDTSADGPEPLAAVSSVLGDGQAVLVFDNCEHVVGSVANVIVEILGCCAQVRVLATSREGLGISGELLVPVGGLSGDAAASLFVDRMAGVDLDPDEELLVARICDRLDRLPLGIELAAGRARHLQLSELLDRLGDPFDVLDGGSLTLPPSQRGLRAVADWSYQLLEDPEREAFECMAVFADGATLDGAATVCAARGFVPRDVERLLGRLVDKSLISVDRAGATTRYRMLQTLYDYALERLRESGAEEVVRRAHAKWVAGVAATVAFGARTTGGTVAAVQDEEVAVRDALTWARAAEPLLALDIVTALAPFWFGSMRVSAGWGPLVAALDATSGADGTRRSPAIAWAALFGTMAFDDVTAGRFAEEAAANESGLRDPVRLGVLALTRALAVGYREQVDGARAERWIGQARDQFTLADHHIGLGYTSFAEGALQLVAGDPGAAGDSLGSAIEVFREHGDHLGLILAVSRMGELAWRTGDIQLFVDMHAELRELGRAGRSEGVIAGATARLAVGRLEQGALDDAHELAKAALASSSGSFMPVVNGYSFRAAGLVNLALGHTVEGRQQLAAAVDAFSRGAGQVGLGQAALCWVDLSVSYLDAGDHEEARRAADRAVEIARATGDPWVRAQAAAQSAVAAAQR